MGCSNRVCASGEEPTEDSPTGNNLRTEDFAGLTLTMKRIKSHRSDCDLGPTGTGVEIHPGNSFCYQSKQMT